MTKNSNSMVEIKFSQENVNKDTGQVDVLDEEVLEEKREEAMGRISDWLSFSTFFGDRDKMKDVFFSGLDSS